MHCQFTNVHASLDSVSQSLSTKRDKLFFVQEAMINNCVYGRCHLDKYLCSVQLSDRKKKVSTTITILLFVCIQLLILGF